MPLPKLRIDRPTPANWATVAAALLGAAAFPPLGWWPLAPLSAGLFLWLLRDRPTDAARSLGLQYGAIYALGTMHWFFGLFGVLALGCIGLMAGYFGLLAHLVALTRGQRLAVRAALVAVFAVGVEWFRGDAWYLRFPWYTIPHALAQEPALIAPVRWLGTYGLSWVIWFVLALAALGRPWYAVPLLALPLGAWALGPVEAPDRKALLVQAEVNGTLDRALAGIGTEPVDLVVLSEYAYFDSYKSVLRLENGPAAVARKVHCPVVFGAVDGDYFSPKFTNVAVVLDGEANLLGLFPKQRPVPLFHDGKPGASRPVFPLSSGQGTLGVAVCYDLDAPAIAAALVDQGATVLVVPTYDAMSWGYYQHVHHELLLRLRAVETDRWIVRAASSGRSEAVDPRGRPSAAGLDIGTAGTVTVAFGHRTGWTLGSQLHPIGPGCAGLALVLMAGWGVRAWRRGKNPPPGPLP